MGIPEGCSVICTSVEPTLLELSTRGAHDPEGVVRHRLRALRQARGWSLKELSARSHISPSTLSRLETGRRRIAVDHLVVLARVLGSTIDELLADDRSGDVIVRPLKDSAGDSTYWLYSDPEDASSPRIARMRIPRRKRLPEGRAHPGRDWFYVIKGTLKIRLGDREILVETGEAASFDTMIPHSLGGDGGPVEILSIFDHHGERAHLKD